MSEGIIANRYVLHEKLGTGGMGAVYRATDRMTGTLVALKRVPLRTRHGGDLDPEDIDEAHLALTLEFRTLASLKHPNIVTVLDYGFEADANGKRGQPYFTMKLLDSPQTIWQAAEGKARSFQVRLVAGMLHALAYLHRRGVIHRDLKPGNVLVMKDRQVKVMDFGLSVARSQSLTNPDEVMVGTLHYMAPEIFTNPMVTPQADLWAAGIMMYEIFAGKYPFDNTNSGTLLYSILHDSPDYSMLEPGIAAVIDRLLQKNAADRYENAEAALNDLAHVTNQPVQVETQAVRESFLQASRFVGREDALETLLAALDAILRRTEEQPTPKRLRMLHTAAPLPNQPQGSAWLIGGESGVGKSRLLDELRIRALVRGAGVIHGQAAAEGGQTYHLWQNPVRHLILSTTISDTEASVLKQIIPDIHVLVGRTIPDVTALQNQQGQTRLDSIILSLFSRQREPLVLILEDLHWATEDLPLLKSLSNMVQDLPLLLIGSYRDDDVPDLPQRLPGMQSIHLPRLAKAQIEELAASMLGEVGHHAQIVELLERETEGNVFFIVQVMRALAEEAGSLAAINHHALPEHVFVGGVQQIVQHRLSRVPHDAFTLLQVAAVIGRQLDLKTLFVIGAGQELLVHNTDLDDWLTVCANAAVIEPYEGGWRFAHDKLRETILMELTDFQHRGIHWRVAEALEALYPDDKSKWVTLADHWHEINEFERELEYIIKAGDEAVLIHAYQDVISYTLRALTILGRTNVPERALYHARLEHRLGVTRRRQGNLMEARIHLQRSLGLYRRLDDQTEMVQVLNDLGWIDQHQGRYVAARECHEAALELARSLESTHGIAEALICLGTIDRATGQYEQARSRYEVSLSIYEDQQDHESIAETLHELGMLAYDMGHYDEAEAHFERRLAMSLDAGYPHSIVEALHNLGRVSATRGSLEAAATYYGESLAMSRRVGDRHHAAYVLHSLGKLAEYQEDVTQARAYYEEALSLLRDLDDLAGTADTLADLGRLARQQLDFIAAERHLKNSLSIYEKIDLNSGVYTVLAELGNLAREQGHYATAMQYLEESHELAQQDGVPTGEVAALTALADVRVAQQDFDAAREYLSTALRMTWAIRSLRDLTGVLTGFARLHLAEGEIARSAELLGLVAQHPAAPYDVIRYGVTSLRAEIQAALHNAIEGGARLELQAVVKDLLRE